MIGRKGVTLSSEFVAYAYCAKLRQFVPAWFTCIVHHAYD